MLITCEKYYSMLVLLLICIAKGAISTTIDYDVGVILDMDSDVGRVGNSCLWMAHSDFYSAHADYKTRLLLHPTLSGNNVVDAAAAALYLLKDVKVDSIIGPQESALDLVMEMGNMAHVPIISFSATTPLINQAPFFVRTAQSDANQVEAIASVVKLFKWSKVVFIYENSEFGSGIIPYLVHALEDVNAQVPYMSVLPKSANNDSIRKELNKMRNMPTRVFVVHVSQSLGTNFFKQVHKLGMMTEGYVWIVTTELMDLFNFGTSGDDDVEAMRGVVGVRPLIPNPDRHKSCGGRSSVFCIWACDTFSALAMAAERVGNYATESEADVNTSGPFSVGVSETGPKLYKALLKTKFTGLAGEFNLINGQLGQTAYQIFNILGSTKKQVGIWTPLKGENTSSELKMTRIIWPGGSTKAPTGWEFPANGSKLRIAVPQKPGFDDLFKVVIDNKTKKTNFSGHYRHVFDAIMKRLPYTLQCEFKAYPLFNSTYDDLMHQVSLQIEYDGALGDFTVTANRSDYVDFTVPYAEGGVACIVPMKQEEIAGVWAFLEPLTTELWIALIIFYISTSIIVWVLLKRIIQYPDFEGQQVGMIHSFPFFPGEGIEASLLCVIVVTWGIVASLLWSTYTASLSSILTAPRLVPTVTSVAQLINQEGDVGYQESSFLKTYLIHLQFNESKLKSFSSLKQVHEALSQKDKNTSGYCDVMPYINYILSKGCGRYTTIYPVYQTVGFAMAFPKGFPAVDDISRAILEIIDNGTILYTNETRDLWDCGDSGTSRESLQSLSGLLAVTGCVILACFVGSLLYGKHRKTSIRQKHTLQPLPPCGELGLTRFDRRIIGGHR